MLRPGERVEGWDRGGADPDAELRALGADRHYFLSRGDDRHRRQHPDRPPDRAISRRRRGASSTAYGAAGERLEQPQVDFEPVLATAT